jgi:hypothetical protein
MSKLSTVDARPLLRPLETKLWRLLVRLLSTLLAVA